MSATFHDSIHYHIRNTFLANAVVFPNIRRKFESFFISRNPDAACHKKTEFVASYSYKSETGWTTAWIVHRFIQASEGEGVPVLK
jgi:hypothetical protein